MKCPACNRKLTEFKAGPVILDACQHGCGGVWFDAQELEQVNQAIPAGKPLLIEIVRLSTIKVDEKRVRKCVRCRGVKLERKLFSLGSGVVLDRCPKCDGLWLDHEELDKIREETNPTPRPVRHVVARRGAAKSIPITFGVVQQVQRLRISQ